MTVASFEDAQTSVEDFLLRREKLSFDIAKMSEFQIRGLSLLLASDRLDLLRQALIAAIDKVNSDELSSWESLASGFTCVDIRLPLDAEFDREELPVRSSKCLLSEFAVPEEENVDCLPPDMVDQIEHVLAQFAACSECCDLCDLSDFPAPEASSPDPLLVASFEIDDEANSHEQQPISQGMMMATLQELKLKDFAIGQLTRQLGFERGRGEWLTSEHHWREIRERHVKCFANRTSDVRNSRRMQDVRTEVEIFMGEDHCLEESYRSNSVNFWMGEATHLDALFHDIQMQASQMREGMSEDEHLEYEAHLMAAFSQLQDNFYSRRSEAERVQSQEMKVLHKHHDKVRKRHLFTIAQIRQEGDENSSDESVDEGEDTRRVDRNLLEIDYPNASADHDAGWSHPTELSEGAQTEERFSEMTTCEPSDNSSQLAASAA